GRVFRPRRGGGNAARVRPRRPGGAKTPGGGPSPPGLAASPGARLRRPCGARRAAPRTACPWSERGGGPGPANSATPCQTHPVEVAVLLQVAAPWRPSAKVLGAGFDQAGLGDVTPAGPPGLFRGTGEDGH